MYNPIFKVVVLLILSTHLSVVMADVKECTPRKGLGNVIEKLERGDEVKIAYFGGSITAQKGYRVKSLEWLQKEYPKAKISEINAAIGGTNSELGVFRMDYDVLPYKPDLVFVEFAVNDGGTSPENIHRAMEGIVRKVWKADATIDICFVYTLTANMVTTLQEGKYPNAAAAMDVLADHYGIPSIHMGLEVAHLVKQGKVVMVGEKSEMTKVSGDDLNVSSDNVNKDVVYFSKDGVHPYVDTGHQLYLEAIVRSFEPIKQAGQKGKHDFSVPFRADNLEQAKMLPFEAILPGKGWEKLPETHPLVKSFKNRMPILWAAENAGVELSLKFKGSYLSFYDLRGPNCGVVNVNIDGKVNSVNHFDKYCSYHRISQMTVLNDKSEGVHTVNVSTSDEVFDKRKILSESNWPDYDKNTKKYEGASWYVGGILMIGELIND